MHNELYSIHLGEPDMNSSRVLRLVGVIAVVAISATGCGNNVEIKKSGDGQTTEYKFELTGCSTGTQKFNSKKEMCAGLVNDELNSGCALEMRYEYFQSHCVDSGIRWTGEEAVVGSAVWTGAGALVSDQPYKEMMAVAALDVAKTQTKTVDEIRTEVEKFVSSKETLALKDEELRKFVEAVMSDADPARKLVLLKLAFMLAKGTKHRYGYVPADKIMAQIERLVALKNPSEAVISHRLAYQYAAKEKFGMKLAETEALVFADAVSALDEPLKTVFEHNQAFNDAYRRQMMKKEDARDYADRKAGLK